MNSGIAVMLPPSLPRSSMPSSSSSRKQRHHYRTAPLLDTNLHEIDVQPLPSPYSPIKQHQSSSSFDTVSASISALASQFDSQFKTPPNTPIDRHQSHNEQKLHFMSLNLALSSPPPSTLSSSQQYHQHRHPQQYPNIFEMQNMQSFHPSMDLQEDPTEGPLRKRARFVSAAPSHHQHQPTRTNSVESILSANSETDSDMSFSQMSSPQ